MKCPICKKRKVKKRGTHNCLTCSRACGLVLAKSKIQACLGMKPSKYPPEYWAEFHRVNTRG